MNYKKTIKKILATVIALSLVLAFMNTSNSYAAVQEGDNVIPSNLKWNSFSVRDDLHTGVNTEWESSLCREMDSELKKILGSYYQSVASYDYGAAEQIENARNEAMQLAQNDLDNGRLSQYEYDELDRQTGWSEGGVLAYQSATHGMISGDNTSSAVTLDCSKTINGTTGWDGQYASMTQGGEKVLVGDNPWGLTLDMQGIPVEFGRTYTMEFDISSTLKNDNYQKTDKHFLVKACDFQSKGEPAASFESVTVDGQDEGTSGICVIKKDVTSHVKATFSIPNSKNEWSSGKDSGANTYMGIKLALGAFAKTYPEENHLQGRINISDMKVIAGPEVPYNPNTEPATSADKTTTSSEIITDKAIETTKTANVTPVTNTKITSIKSIKAKKKSLKISWKKVSGVNGYQLQYATKKSMKGAKTVNIKAATTSKTIKKLKKKKKYYVRIRTFILSNGKSVYSPWSAKKVKKTK